MTTRRVRSGIFGASGYVGGEILRYVAAHPNLQVEWATAETNAGRRVGELYPGARAFADVVLRATDEEPPELDVAFLALPHGGAAELGQRLRDGGVLVVDVSADWRLRDPAAYESWYGWTHPAPERSHEWVYGLPEVYREEIACAAGVANPGCFPTAAVLAMRPLLEAGVVERGTVIVDAMTGVSGAGRKADTAYLLAELDANVSAYGVGTHRHTPEMEQELGVAVVFTPHLVPMSRGLLVTCYAPLSGTPDGPRRALESAYADEAFVHVMPERVQPATKHTSGTNLAMIGCVVDERTSTAIVTCAIDNLGKGAAGQAVQNANIMLGLDEHAGLRGQAVFP